MPCVSVVKGLAPRLLKGAVPKLSNKSLVTEFAFPTLPARWGLDCSRFPVWLWPEQVQATGRSVSHHTLECFVLRQERLFSHCCTPIPKGEGDGGISNALKSVRTGTP